MKLYCGASKKCITPSPELLPELYGLMGRSFSTVHDELYLRVIAFSNGESKALIVSFDLDKAPQPEAFLSKLSESTGIPVENILYFGIHTHTAPLCGPRPDFEKPKTEAAARATEKYEAFVLEKLLSAAEEALSAMEPARIGTGSGMSYLNVNRNQHYYYTASDGTEYDLMGLGADFEGPVDHTARVIKIENPEGRTIAMLVNYALHNVVMILNDPLGDGRVGIGADVGGNVSRCLEENYGGVAIWSSAAAGDINPVMMNQYFYADPLTGESRGMDVHSSEAAEAMLNIMTGRHLSDLKQIIKNISCEETDAFIGGDVQWSSTPTENPEESWDIRLQALRIGSLAFMGIGGELYTTLGKAVMDASPFENTWVINHNCSLIKDTGYILDDAALARVKVKAPGLNTSRWVPGGGHAINLPGTVRPSLEKYTELMFKKLS